MKFFIFFLVGMFGCVAFADQPDLLAQSVGEYQYKSPLQDFRLKLTVKDGQYHADFFGSFSTECRGAVEPGAVLDQHIETKFMVEHCFTMADSDSDQPVALLSGIIRFCPMYGWAEILLYRNKAPGQNESPYVLLLLDRI